MEKLYYARTRDDNPDPASWQLLEDHLDQTADVALNFCGERPWRRWAALAGRWHDLGKYAERFQQRLRDNRIRATHSTAGAKAAEKVFTYTASGEHLVARMLGYVIAGHHGGLPDGNSAEDSCLAVRLRNAPSLPSSCPANLLDKPDITIHDLDDLFLDRPPEEFPFSLSFFIRMLFSCVVDADRLNSEAFADPDKARIRAEYPSLGKLQERLAAQLAELSLKEPSLEINRHRAAILEQCLAAAEHEPGLFSLTVPTGGGKTLSSLAFAMKHALKHDLRRIIYVIPYTSIIEQNALVFRECLGDSAVVEHHSNYDPPDDTDETSPHSLAMENWDAPLIVTTNVQFFESLFSHKPSRCRKLHNIMDSVIILDEAQMLPPDLLRPCLAAIRELTGRYHTTAVLCTATQPALSRDDGLKDGLEHVREIIDNREQLYTALERVDIEFAGKMDDEGIASCLTEHEQALCIVNTRTRARRLFDLCGKIQGMYHLSALMCPAHRTQILDEIRENLKDGSLCRVISTQLIEAGVDIDFPVVFRELSGVDSIAQAAGRCNREGKLTGHGKVYVFEPPDGAPRLFRQQAQATQAVRRHHDDVLSLEGIREYFRELYWVKGDEQLDAHAILARLLAGGDKADFPFREIGEEFRLIDENTESLFIPWDTAGKAIEQELRREKPSRAAYRKAQRYTVSLYNTDYMKLHTAGAVKKVHDTISILLNQSLYDRQVGLKLDNPYYRDSESNII